MDRVDDRGLPVTDRTYRSLALVSRYPPTRCGIATFTQALVEALATRRGTREGLGVVRLLDEPDPSAAQDVVYELRSGDPNSIEAAIDALHTFDVALVQHEYGIFGGEDGEDVVQLLHGLRIPSIVTLHTVPAHPSVHQRRILEAIVDRADRVVVMAHAARRWLVDRYRVAPGKIHVIPHGAHGLARANPGSRRQPTILTWGLIGPGKGIELALGAMARLRHLDPRPRYLVRGQTHPAVYRTQGEAYREMLLRRVHELGLEEMVEIQGAYLGLEELGRLVAGASVVLCPYESREQMTSGVLAEAVAAGKPVVATAFPHAVELLSSGAGRVVPHDDPAAIAAALEEIMTDSSVARRMAREARRIAPSLLWPAVAGQYLEVAEELRAWSPAVA
jgi:polysaccharide biosynthesis protein PslF